MYSVYWCRIVIYCDVLWVETNLIGPCKRWGRDGGLGKWVLVMCFSVDVLSLCWLTIVRSTMFHDNFLSQGCSHHFDGCAG